MLRLPPTMESVAEAIQYPPEAAISLTQATVGFPRDLIASATSSQAKGVPPLQFTSSTRAFVRLFLLMLSKRRTISAEAVVLRVRTAILSEMSTPFMGSKAILSIFPSRNPISFSHYDILGTAHLRVERYRKKPRAAMNTHTGRVRSEAVLRS